MHGGCLSGSDSCQRPSPRLAGFLGGEEGARAAEVVILSGLGSALYQSGEVDQARDWLGQALALAEKLGMRPLAARCRLALGALELKAGRANDALAWLAPTVGELQAMGIGRWLARAERLLAETTERQEGCGTAL